MTDQELIAGIVKRDQEAIQHLVHVYHKQVIKTAWYFLQDMDEAEDLAQDVCLEILEKAAGFRGTAAFSSWVYRITINKSLNVLKKRKWQHLAVKIEEAFKSGSRNPEPSGNENPLLDAEAKIVLTKALQHLPENQRVAFTLNKYEEMTAGEIAGIMQTTTVSVESLIQRAKHNLQKYLLKHYQEYAQKK